MNLNCFLFIVPVSLFVCLYVSVSIAGLALAGWLGVLFSSLLLYCLFCYLCALGAILYFVGCPPIDLPSCMGLQVGFMPSALSIL